MADILHITRREAGLPAVLGPAQMAGIAFGAVISYGLISGEVLPLALAGPVAVLGYVAATCVVLLLMHCLVDMAASHPVPSAFGAYAEAYLGPRIGVAVRAAYLMAVICIAGTEVALLEPLFRFLLAPLPAWVGGVLLLVGLGILNGLGARASARFGLILAVLKVIALVALIAFACFQILIADDIGTQTDESVWADIWAEMTLPSLWQVSVVATLGFIGIETMAVAVAETTASASTLRRYMRWATGGVLALTLCAVAASAWFQMHYLVPFNVQPFVYLMGLTGLSAVGALFNVLLLLTVVSVLNSQIYAGSRQFFGLAKAGRAPAALASARQRGISGSAAGTTLLSILVYLAYGFFPVTAYVLATSIALTALLAVWGAIFAAHIGFRRQAGGKSWQGMVGGVLVLAIAVSTLQIDVLDMALLIGMPFIALIFLFDWLYGLVFDRLKCK